MMATMKQLLAVMVTLVVSVTAYIEDDLVKLQYYNKLLTQQLMNQQMFLEERLRSEGSSGIKQVRQTGQGSKTYFSNSHVGHSFMGMSNRANLANRVGLDPIEAVLNGVNFITRRNDYTLRKPHSISSTFGETEPIEFPEVPPEVTAKATVQEQIDEMKEWFKAFKDQDHSVRDYRPYFTAILCYLEGAWVNTEEGNVHELSDNKKDFMNSNLWSEYHKKSEFQAYTGVNGEFDDYASLPKKVIDVVNSTNILFAQFNYRIMCHPLANELKTNRFVPEEDLARRIIKKNTMAEHVKTPEARFRLCIEDKDDCAEDDFYYWGIIDELMYQIPGMDNYPGELTDDVLRLAMHAKDSGHLNAARYHRIFKANAAGAMGRTERYRGFTDLNGYMAMTSSSNVPGIVMDDECKFYGDDLQCKDQYYQRWTYATPLEIIYLTPLQKWNPYNIPDNADPTDGNSRTGGLTTATAYNGANDDFFYRTPAGFFSGSEICPGPTDTIDGAVGVLDGSGNVQNVYASGIRIFLPEIEGVGSIRQRYPIAGVHGEGGQAWKELAAFREIVTHSFDKRRLFLSQTGRNMTYLMTIAYPDPENNVVPHLHYVNVRGDDLVRLWSNEQVPITTEPSSAGDSHTHELIMRYYSSIDTTSYVTCDGLTKCHHSNSVVVVTNSLCF